jgi:hypothetical protein
MRNQIVFMVEYGNIHYITYAFDRESAKRSALGWIGGNSDNYIVTPLTEPGDRIHIGITLYV